MANYQQYKRRYNQMDKGLIKHLRFISDMNQSQLAERVGVHQTLISKAEAGLIELKPKTETKLLQVFNDEGITPQDIALLSSVFESKKLKKVRKDWKQVNG
jgi:DNA-binding XRE family transcriptional regulator